MMLLKELGMALAVGIAFAGVLTVIITNNPSTWYKTSKIVKEKLNHEKKRHKNIKKESYGGNDMNEKILPLGTIVTLKNGDGSKLMVLLEQVLWKTMAKKFILIMVQF